MINQNEKRTLIIGSAGLGKSCVCSQIIDLLNQQNIHLLTIRMDSLPGDILSTTELGRKLNLPESPTITLAGIANGKKCVLIVDQLDAISIVSGRNPQLWNVFEDIIYEVDDYPNMHILILCRSFDLDHDPRLRKLNSKDSNLTKIKLRPFAVDEVKNILHDLQIKFNLLNSNQIKLLQIPLHLYLYLEGDPQNSTSFQNLQDLYNRFWEQKRNKVREILGREPKWTEIINNLCKYFSDYQRLNAPNDFLDDFDTDAKAMATENVLIIENETIRFFHEGFFDYAFARRFVQSDGDLIELLIGSRKEQHLFRRSQVRQVLSYKRDRHFESYLMDIERLIKNRKVRFHLKISIFNWLHELSNPKVEECNLLMNFLHDKYRKIINKKFFRNLSKKIVPTIGLHNHIINIFRNSAEWFEALDKQNFWEKRIYSNNDSIIDETIWLFSFNNVIKIYSSRIAALIKHFKNKNDKWKQRFRYLFKLGDVHYSREMMDLFLDSIDDGTLDGARPGFAVNDDCWSMLYGMSKENPEYCAEAIAHWLDRICVIADENQQKPFEQKDANSLSGVNIIKVTSQGAPITYVKLLLPRIINLIVKYEYNLDNGKIKDEIWAYLTYSENIYSIEEMILKGFCDSLKKIAAENQKIFDEFIKDLIDLPHYTVSFILLSSWIGNPKRYADQTIEYVISDPHRFDVGYSISGVGGSDAGSMVSREAIKTCSPYCSQKLFEELENSIINFADEWEKKNPKQRGYFELSLLECLPQNRLSKNSQIRLEQLHRKFPNEKFDPPQPMRTYTTSSPISKESTKRMTDDHWIKAMKKYVGERERNIDNIGKGGESELAQVLKENARENKLRFALLCMKMDNDISASYFSAILEGISHREDKETKQSNQNKMNLSSLDLKTLMDVIKRIHSLPQKSCGESICRSIEKVSDFELSKDLFEIVSYYAIHDPNPKDEAWQTKASNGQYYYSGDPYLNGINTTRGQTAITISKLVFSDPDRFSYFKDTIEKICKDKSMAVRSCVVIALIACLNADSDFAMKQFITLADKTPEIYSTNPFERFLYYAVARDYKAVHPILKKMLKLRNENIVKAASRQICLAAFNDKFAEKDASTVRYGNGDMRIAAAEIYSANLKNEELGEMCERYLKHYFNDNDKNVREKASNCFWNLTGNQLKKYEQLIRHFIRSKSFAEELGSLVHAIHESTEILPDVICDCAEKTIKVIGTDGANIQHRASYEAERLAAIVIRLYEHTSDPKIKTRCLELIDKMEELHFHGISKELEKLDKAFATIS